MKKTDLSLILACFNEGPTLKDSLEQITETLQSLKYKWEIIAIDDNSLDSTYKKLVEFSETRKNISVFKNSYNIGRGGTVALGIKKAKGNIVGFIDADLEVSPVYLIQFVKAIEKGADLAIAVRIYRGSLASLDRWVLSKGYNFLITKILDLNIEDTEAGYKFFNRKKILPILNLVKDKKWFFDTEIIARASAKKYKIAEIPVLFIRRSDKKSTVKIISDVIAYLKAIYLFKKR